jgi:4-amino-4-deoxy-L-arabinose transferase-like glycosyltransferase
VPRPARLAAAGALLFVLAFQLWVSPRNPPGFHHDEAAFALNAYTIAHHLRDQDGAFLPVLFPSYGDYKAAAFSYVLAPVLLVFGPSDEAARSLAAAFGVAAVLLVGLLAWRRAGPWIAVAAACLAGLTPWLFQLGRVAYDTSAFPFAVVFLLVAVDGWARARFSLPRSAFVGVALAVLTYAYGAGRLLAPLLAVALVVFVRRVPWRSLAGAWVAYGVLLVPFAAYRLRHPHGLTARYHQTTFVQPGMSLGRIVTHALGNYLSDLDPWRWLVSGDHKPYVDVWGAPQLLAVAVALAALGLVDALRRRDDRFWLYVVAAYFLSAVPAAFTVDRHDALRLSAMPACLAVLAIPGLQALARLRRQMLLPIAAVLVAATLAEWGFFVHVYSSRGQESRATVFEVDVPALVARGLAGGRTIYVDHDDAYALTMGQWYAVSHGLPASRVVRLPDGAVPPKGSMVLGRTQSCDYVCDQLAEADSFWLARAVGPRPTG